jgi:hypothetical protein
VQKSSNWYYPPIAPPGVSPVPRTCSGQRVSSIDTTTKLVNSPADPSNPMYRVLPTLHFKFQDFAFAAPQSIRPRPPLAVNEEATTFGLPSSRVR